MKGENEPLVPVTNHRPSDHRDEKIKSFSIGRSLLCDPSRWLHRYTMLFLMCTLSFGSYFVYDNPAALQRQITQVMGVNSANFMLLYSLYSWPNVILSLGGGYLIDRVFGIRVGTVIFSVFVCLGQVIFAMGANLQSYNVMLAGRFVFGIGGENLAVAQNTYAVAWFKEKEINMVFGLLLSVARLGSTVNMNILAPIYEGTASTFPEPHQRLAFTLWIGVFFCVLSLLAAVVLGLFDRRAAKILRRDEAKTGEVINIKDILYFPMSLWLIFLICVLYYVTVFPFVGLGIVFFEDKWQYSATKANAVNSLVYIISAVASPFLGVAVDATGFNVMWVNLGVISTLGSHALLAFTRLLPFVTMALMGLSYSILACALWPMVAYVVPEHQLGTAYGIMQSIQNLGLAIVSLLAGVILDAKGYILLEVFFLALLCGALIAGVVLYMYDAAKGSKLNKPAWVRRREAKKKEESESAAMITNEEKERINSTKPYTSPIQPSSAFHLRNRLLSRIGTRMPEHVKSYHKSPFYRLGVLK
ncbi:major facilitator superfamily domain-containing protein 1-like [Dysidea avara]|uniref:major facilitator superfamily domain-containing protein 1-like n=1 Tax=Dysidea avara TaxID=196820 RepID=UPI003328894D